MSRHKTGINREQISFEPLCFDALIDEENPVRAIDSIAERFDVHELGFAYSETKDTGRKPYSPSDMLKLYLYGYMKSEINQGCYGVRPKREKVFQVGHTILWTANSNNN